MFCSGLVDNVDPLWLSKGPKGNNSCVSYVQEVEGGAWRWLTSGRECKW
jgi:hypothetical protein